MQAFQALLLMTAAYYVATLDVYIEGRVKLLDCRSQRHDGRLTVGSTTQSHVTEGPVNPEEFYERARDGDLHYIKSKLSGVIDINWRNEDDQNYTSLHIASENGHASLILLLISHGADVNKLASGESPLSIASNRGNVEAVEVLLNAGAQVGYAQPWNGWTALHTAAAYIKQKDVARLLLQNGADINHPANISGRTPVYLAAEAGNTAVLELLVTYGADVNSVDNHGNSPLIIASKNGNVGAVKSLLKAGALLAFENDNSFGMTALHGAAVNNQTEVIRILLQNGADINLQTKRGMTPLGYATMHDKTAALELLVARGADINLPNNDGYSTIYRAAQNGNTEALELLIAHGADVNKVSNNGDSPLGIASWWGKVVIAKILLNTGAEVDHADSYGHTALYKAAWFGRTAAVELLVDHGADVNKVSNDGTSPLVIASRGGHVEASKALLNAGAQIGYARTSDGWTALHNAAYNNHAEFAHFLLENGADKTKKDSKDRTPAAVAREYNHDELAELIDNY